MALINELGKQAVAVITAGTGADLIAQIEALNTDLGASLASLQGWQQGITGSYACLNDPTCTANCDGLCTWDTIEASLTEFLNALNDISDAVSDLGTAHSTILGFYL